MVRFSSTKANLTHCILVDSSTIVCSTSPFLNAKTVSAFDFMCSKRISEPMARLRKAKNVLNNRALMQPLFR